MEFFDKKDQGKQNCFTIEVCSLASKPSKKEGRKHLALSQAIQNQDKGDEKNQIEKIIELNEQYFRNKIKVTQNGRPNNCRFKIPSSTGKTIYEKNFTKKVNNSMQKPIFQEKKLIFPFENQSIYQKQYVWRPQKLQIKKKQRNRALMKSPSFMETQYGHYYVNWGKNAEMESMKPFTPSGATNLPFQANSTYKAEFSKKITLPDSRIMTMPIEKNNQINKKKEIKKKIPFMTTHKAEFKNKKKFQDLNYKPGYRPLNKGVIFTGKSEYQGKYIDAKEKKRGENENELTLAQLKSFIIDL